MLPLNSVACLPALRPWAPPAERGPSLESIYRVSLIVDLCEGNKIISLKKIISPQPVGGPSKRKKNPGALGTCPVCPLVKMALTQLLVAFILVIIGILFHSRFKAFLPFLQILPTVAVILFFRIDSTDSPDCLPILLSISVFYFLVFFV